ncbi:MAG: excisionase family DNA-binding protein [Balneolaceae bacterium]|nr:excisionase family DNA-binding protein [Balneolaceae bacterium]
MKNLQILTIKEVCQLLNVSVPTIYRWESEGTLPFPKIRVGPNRVGFRQVDVEAYINNQIEPVEIEAVK